MKPIASKITSQQRKLTLSSIGERSFFSSRFFFSFRSGLLYLKYFFLLSSPQKNQLHSLFQCEGNPPSAWQRFITHRQSNIMLKQHLPCELFGKKDLQFSCLETVLQLLGNCKASGSTYSAHGTREIQMRYTLIQPPKLKGKKRLIIAKILGNLNGPQWYSSIY